MKQLTEAIYTHFNANVVGATKLYNTLAPEDATFPYVVLLIIPGSPDDTLTESSDGYVGIETGIIQFTIYSREKLPDEAYAIQASIHAAFDYTRELTMADYNLPKCKRGIGIITKEEVQGKLAWKLMTQYDFRLELKN